MSGAPTKLSLRRLNALVVKECLQAVRDPSTFLIAFVLPPLLLWLFANAVSLDIRNVAFGVAVEGEGFHARQLASAYRHTPYFDAHMARDRRELEPLLRDGSILGMVVIPAEFDAALLDPGRQPTLQVITDGSAPNTANFVQGYALGVYDNWLLTRDTTGPSGAVASGAVASGAVASGAAASGAAAPQPRFWFNPELDSRHTLALGGMAIVMTLIGTMLTALVVAREWERGTMEAMMSTPAAMLELLVSKLIPYFMLGMLAAMGCSLISVLFFDLPFRGSVLALTLASACFMVPALGQGLLISTLSRNQFIAAQGAVFSGFMPATLLSGALYEIDSMPLVLQWVCAAIPASHYVASLQTVFLVGDTWTELLRQMLALLLIGCVFFAITLRYSRKRLD